MADIDFSPLEKLVERTFGAEVSWHADAMPGGASTRKFFRLYFEGGSPRSAVAFFVPDATRSDEIDKTDGVRPRWPFLEVQELLAARGVAVPRILADGSDQGWLVVEDLGDDTLANFLLRNPGQKEALYRAAVRDLARAQRALAELPEGSVVRRRTFDEELLLWEIHHFREWALEARGLCFSAEDRRTFDAIAARLASRIASWPRGFVHRDYQSRNLMVVDGPTLVWIDFQDALLGPRVYDLVALLNDSYQTFDRSFVEARLDDFASELGLDAEARRQLGVEFDLVTVQRKLKDAGRFVFIERTKNNSSFLRFVEPTLEKVKSSLERLRHDEDMVALREILERTLS
ncbi:MAG: phosphotransferase [Myxococcales bacterium]|nr:phosphotransferase [Myxococcales bacterium]